MFEKSYNVMTRIEAIELSHKYVFIFAVANIIFLIL